MNKLIQRSLLNALGTIAYVTAIVLTVFNGERIFGQINNTLAPIIFLTLFVLSAAITGGLVLGKPVLMYLDNQKNAALRLFIYTLCWLALAIIILLIVALVLK
jgi:hypothetical protein